MPSGGKRKGSGRKSAYQELADAKLLLEMFFGEHDAKKVMAKIKTGKYSLLDLYIAKAYGGNDAYIVRVFEKVFPDRVSMEDSLDDGALSKAAKERLAKYEDADQTDDKPDSKPKQGAAKPGQAPADQPATVAH